VRLPLFPGLDHRDMVHRIVGVLGHPSEEVLPRPASRPAFRFDRERASAREREKETERERQGERDREREREGWGERVREREGERPRPAFRLDTTALIQSFLWQYSPAQSFMLTLPPRRMFPLAVHPRGEFFLWLAVEREYMKRCRGIIRWTGLAPWELDFPFPGSLKSTFLSHIRVPVQ